MTQQPLGASRRIPRAGLKLDYPMSLGVFEEYAQAQKAVDFLADHEFEVQNLMIVGTDLKQVERVTGRLTRSRVATAGALSGMWLGAFVGLFFALFGEEEAMRALVTTIIAGALFGLVWGLIGYALTGGQRDFTSVSQVVATKYEVLVEHKLAQKARELLATMPGTQTLL